MTRLISLKFQHQASSFYRCYSSNSSTSLEQIKNSCQNILKVKSYDQVLQESKKFVHIYSNMDVNERSKVISFLSKDYAVDHEKIKNAITK